MSRRRNSTMPLFVGYFMQAHKGHLGSFYKIEKCGPYGLQLFENEHADQLHRLFVGDGQVKR